MSEGARTGRLWVGVPAALLAGALGVFLGSSTVFLTAAVALAYTAYGGVTRPPATHLAAERTVTEPAPRPGQSVDVTLTVTNTGDRALPDVRVSDPVPDGLRVLEGETARCTSLRPGEALTVSYTVGARRGEYVFEEPLVTVHNVSASRAETVETGVETTLTCRAFVERVPLTDETVPYTGRVATDSGGEGVEFYATREYVPGDPVKRIDWNRLASTTELRTIEFRETEAATVVVVVDTTASARVSRREGEPTGLALCEHAAGRLVDALLDEHNRVGLALLDHTLDTGFSLVEDPPEGGDNRYLPPGAGRDQSVRVRRVLDGEDGADGEGADLGRTFRYRSELRAHLPSDVQVVYCSPLLSDDPADTARTLGAHGIPVTVVSPDLTNPGSVGGSVAGVERAVRLRSLRGDGVRVVDWSPDEPLAAALETGTHRWS